MMQNGTNRSAKILNSDILSSIAEATDFRSTDELEADEDGNPAIPNQAVFEKLLKKTRNKSKRLYNQ